MKDLLGIIGILVISKEIYLWLQRRWIHHVLEGKKKERRQIESKKGGDRMERAERVGWAADRHFNRRVFYV